MKKVSQSLVMIVQDCGWSDPPFRWDEERRILLRCELDAANYRRAERQYRF